MRFGTNRFGESQTAFEAINPKKTNSSYSKAMKKDNRNLIWVWYFAMCIPIAQAFIIIKNKNLNGFCENLPNNRAAKGVFCEWGPELGTELFGIANAHLGMSLLLFLSALIGIGFGIFMTRKSS